MKSQFCVSLVFLFLASSLSALEPDFQQTPKPTPLKNPPTRDQILQSIGKGINFLIEHQNPNGSWGSARRTKQLNIYALGSSHDAYRAGTTALGLTALLEVEAAAWQKTGPGREPEGKKPLDFEKLGVDREKFDLAINKAEIWLLDHLPKLRRSHNDILYNIWGHAYGIKSLVRMLHRPVRPDSNPDAETERAEKIKEIIRGQVDMLRRCEALQGGWFYYDDNVTSPPSTNTASFVTATVLIALKEAEREGIEIPEKMIRTSMESLKRQRLPDFAYLYSLSHWKSPRYSINRPAGSLGRSQSCNLAMKWWGDETVTDEVLIRWLDRLYARNGWLDVGRKRPIPHESFFLIAGYFFYYAHYYAALCIEEIPEKERGVYREFLADVLVGLQETDGSWWDYPLYDYHQAYGTGYAIQSLLRALD